MDARTQAVGCRLWAGGPSSGTSSPTYSLQPAAYSLAARQRGFTLVELVVAISIGAIVVSFAAMFIHAPMQAYAAQTRRAGLVDSADSLLRLMARDVRRALPNSVRIASAGSMVAMETLSTVDAVRYRDTDATTAPNDELDFSQADAQFTTLGKFNDIGTRPFTTTDHFLSIYNVGISGADAYELANVITPAGTSITIDDGIAGEDRITLSPSMQFAYGSPGRRVFLVSGPVTYLCDTSAGTVRRYVGYDIGSVQMTTPADLNSAGASSALLAARVSTCAFSYSAGTAQRAGLVTLDVTIADGTERVRLLHQVHVENVP
jgi:MSHA biogenesis protein MshO